MIIRKLQYNLVRNQYHVYIPISVIDELGWRKGDEIGIIIEDNDIKLIKVNFK